MGNYVNMNFICPVCSKKETLMIIQSITLPPDSRSDDIIVQVVMCQGCDFKGAAIYQESRRGSLDSEHWEHIGYHVRDIQLEALMAVMAGCPKPGSTRCSCQVHSLLGQKIKNGLWRRPAGFDDHRTFPMLRS